MVRASLILAALLAASPALAQKSVAYLDFKGQSSAPSSPPSGRYRLYLDNSGNLKWKNSAGSISTASTGGGGGGGTLSSIYAAGLVADNTLAWTAARGGLIIDDGASAGSGGPAYLQLTIGGSLSVLSVGFDGVLSQYDGIATNDTLGVWTIENPTAAALGAQQYSPDLRLRGHGWATGASASRTVDFHIQTQPVQGTTPTGNLIFSSRINGGSIFAAMGLTSGGVLSLGGGLASGTSITSPALSGTATGTYTLGGTPTIGSDVTLSAGVDINGSSTSDITMRHFLGKNGATPSISVGAYLGGGSSASIAGTDHGGEITLTANSGGSANSPLFTVTYAQAFPNGSAVVVHPSSDGAAAWMNNYNVNADVKVTSNASGFTLEATAQSGTGAWSSTALKWKYIVQGW